MLTIALLGCGRASSQDPAPSPPPATATATVPAAAAAAATATDAATDAATATATAAAPDLAACQRIPFAASLPLAEASGAEWLPRDGGVIMVVADSGHDGAYLVIDDADGRVLESGKLPLGAAGGDDLEGLASDGDRIWAITSSGWLRAWRRRPRGGFQLVVPAYRIDDEDPCPVDAVNCGRNYEGLCLAPSATAAAALGCGGFAAAKATGDLVCLVADGDRWRADPARTIHVAASEVLAACDITADGAVWTGDNLFGGNTVRRIVGGAVAGSARLGDGFPEAMAISPDGTLYRFSDTGGAPSRVVAYRCPPPARGEPVRGEKDAPTDGGE